MKNEEKEQKQISIGDTKISVIGGNDTANVVIEGDASDILVTLAAAIDGDEKLYGLIRNAIDMVEAKRYQSLSTRLQNVEGAVGEVLSLINEGAEQLKNETIEEPLLNIKPTTQA